MNKLNIVVLFRNLRKLTDKIRTPNMLLAVLEKVKIKMDLTT